MVKRERNKIGQFVSVTSMAKNTGVPFEIIFHKAFIIFMVIFLFAMACPWITLAIKSKTIKIWVFCLIDFCNSHFVGIDESRESNDAYVTAKDPNDLQ